MTRESLVEDGARLGTRVAVADDDVLLRNGLAVLLAQARYDVVGQVGDADELLVLVRQHVPHLVIVDVRMPPTHTTEGLEAARSIRAEFPETAVLVLSAHVEVEEAMDLLATGARTGYLLKNRITDIDDFLESVDRIVRGGSVIDPGLVQELVIARRFSNPLEGLTKRERQVLALMAQGLSNVGIAGKLVVTEGTVEKHVHAILRKLRLPNGVSEHRRVLAVLTYLGGGERTHRG